MLLLLLYLLRQLKCCCGDKVTGWDLVVDVAKLLHGGVVKGLLWLLLLHNKKQLVTRLELPFV